MPHHLLLSVPPPGRDIIEVLKQQGGYTRVFDMSGEEANKRYFEGTGVLIIDRINGVVYVNVSVSVEGICERGQRGGERFFISHTNMFPIPHSLRRSHFLSAFTLSLSSHTSSLPTGARRCHSGGEVDQGDGLQGACHFQVS